MSCVQVHSTCWAHCWQRSETALAIAEVVEDHKHSREYAHASVEQELEGCASTLALDASCAPSTPPRLRTATRDVRARQGMGKGRERCIPRAVEDDASQGGGAIWPAARPMITPVSKLTPPTVLDTPAGRAILVHVCSLLRFSPRHALHHALSRSSAMRTHSPSAITLSRGPPHDTHCEGRRRERELTLAKRSTTTTKQNQNPRCRFVRGSYLRGPATTIVYRERNLPDLLMCPRCTITTPHENVRTCSLALSSSLLPYEAAHAPTVSRKLNSPDVTSVGCCCSSNTWPSHTSTSTGRRAGLWHRMLSSRRETVPRRPQRSER